MSGSPRSFFVLGPLEVRREGCALDLGTPKQRRVLASLLVAAPAPVSVERLAAQVWHRPPPDPLRSLQVYVSGLRRALGDDGTLLRTGHRSYRLDLTTAVVDADQAWSAAARARDLLDGPTGAGADTSGPEVAPADALRLLDEALAQWRGPAWAGLRDVPVVAAHAQALDQVHDELRVLRARAMLGLGRHREVVADLERLVAGHPDDDAVLGLLLLALHRSGRPRDALDRYAVARRERVTATGLEPGAALQHLHAQMLADDPALAHVTPDLQRRRHLPAPVTSLVGRRDEVAEVVRAVRTSRLTTLTGAGGIGKTRVGLQAAHELAADFPDGVWWVGLATVRDPALLPQAVCDVMGLDEPRPPSLVLRDHLADRRALLLADNLEQIADGAEWLGEMLSDCPGMRVLATSRTALRLYGEHLVPLAGLDPGDAVRLLSERAAAAGHGAAVAPGTAARLVESLDFLPLAIELVAARLGEVPVDELVAGSSPLLGAAVDGPRDRSSRQQTLRGAITWSTDLLPAPARAAFIRLGVFDGGFTTADALLVAETDEATLGLLSRASLLRGPVDGRWWMLETVRELALETLVEVDDADRVRGRHAARMQAVVAEAVGALRTGGAAETTVATARLLAERGDVRAALTWLHGRAPYDREAATSLLRLVADLALHWYRSSPGSDDVRWLRRALDAAPAADPVLRARALHGLAICRAEQGRSSEALQDSRESLHVFREAADEPGTARAANTHGGLLQDLGRVSEALPYLEESVAIRRRLADPALPLWIALGNVAMALRDTGDLARARVCLLECLEVVGAEEPERSLAQAALAGIALDEGQTEEARALLARAVPQLRAGGLRFRLIEVVDTWAGLAAQTGRVTLALTLLAAADRALREDDAELTPGDRALRERWVLSRAGDCPPAVRAEAEARGEALELEAALDLAAETLGDGTVAG